MIRRWCGLRTWLIAGCLVAQAVPAVAQQRGPIQLFPGPSSEQTPETPPARTPQGVEPGQPDDGGRPGGLPPDGFEVEGLAAPAIDAIGLDGGFGPEFWQGSDPELVLKLIDNLPVVTRNPPLREAARRLLITGTNLPIDRSGRLLEARVRRLVAMGSLQDAAGLLDQLPATDRDSALVRRAADVALLLGDDERACRLANDVTPATEAPYWTKLTAYCRLRSGDIDGGRLALNLLREAGAGEDRVFFDLAEALAGDGSNEAVADPARLSPLHVAMLRSAELPLPEAALADPPPPLLAAIAQTPALAPEAGLELAERSFMVGVLSAGELAARYMEAAPEDSTGGDLLSEIGDDWGPAVRARALRRVREEQVAVASAELLDAVWLAADGPERILVARAFAQPFAGLPVDDGLVFVAPSVARALLGAERAVPAARWFSLLRSDGDGDGQPLEAAAELAPLFALAGIGGSERVPEPNAEMIAAWRRASGVEQAGMMPLLALLGGVSGPVAPAVWRDALEPPFETSAEIPSVALWRLLAQAEADQRRGEAVLIGLHLLNGDLREAHPEAVVRGLRALRDGGLDGEARAIAVAAALMAGF